MASSLLDGTAATQLLPDGTVHKGWSCLQWPDPQIIQVTKILDFHMSLLTFKNVGTEFKIF